jgi:simple sugar transport system ATP-binding protein
MTVAENLALGGHGRLQTQVMSAVVRDIAAATGFALESDARVETLPVGAQQRVEIAKALARRAHILILDEPTAVLAPAESEELLRWIRGFADAGQAVVLITHRLPEALAVADVVTVLRHGRVVHTGIAADSSERSLTVAMIGETSDVRGGGATPGTLAASTRDANVPESSAPAVLAARNITVRGEDGSVRLHDASLVVRAGEIVGVAGVEGAGQRELLRALAGRRAVSSGSLERPRQVGFVPEDRHRDAVLLDRSLVDNVALRNAGARRGRMHWRALRTRTEALMRDFDVRAPSATSTMRILSGGNQQKLVLAREMTGMAGDEPARGATPATHEALVVENPTRGLDVRATAEVHARLLAARDRGLAIVLYSSDLDEVLALATRVVVVRAGVLREVPLDRDAVGRAMLGTA